MKEEIRSQNSEVRSWRPETRSQRLGDGSEHVFTRLAVSHTVSPMNFERASEYGRIIMSATATMSMSDPEIAMLTAAVNTARHYLEYGTGDSTKLAVRVPTVSSVTSVESDPAFISSHLSGDADIQAATQSGRLRFLIVNIGPTGAWGNPLDRSKVHLWPNYALCPYLHGYHPDLILIDGRFRVACGLAAALQAFDATILIHDYPNRQHYHILERFLKIEDGVDTLVRCRRLANLDEDSARRLLGAYLYSPADLSPTRRAKLRRYISKTTRRLTNRLFLLRQRLTLDGFGGVGQR